MCQFVLAVLPASADLAAAGRLFAAHHLGFKLVVNPSLQPQLEAGDRCILTTRGQCDCGTPLGARGTEHGDPDHTLELAKLKKKGWGEAKLKRWLAQRTEAEALARAARASRGAVHQAGLDEWLAFLNDALAQLPRLGLLLQTYRGGVESERLEIRREAVPRASLNTGFLIGLSEGVVYEFMR